MFKDGFMGGGTGCFGRSRYKVETVVSRCRGSIDTVWYWLWLWDWSPFDGCMEGPIEPGNVRILEPV